MGSKSHESDRHGRITVYPSLHDPGRRSPGLVLKLIRKLLDTARGVRQNKPPES